MRTVSLSIEAGRTGTREQQRLGLQIIIDYVYTRCSDSDLVWISICYCFEIEENLYNISTNTRMFHPWPDATPLTINKKYILPLKYIRNFKLIAEMQ